MTKKVKRCGTATGEAVYGKWDDVFRGVDGKASDFLYMGLHKEAEPFPITNEVLLKGGDGPDAFDEVVLPELLADGAGSFANVADTLGYCMCHEGAEAVCVNAMCPRKILHGKPFPIDIAVPPDADPGIVEFSHDLSESMINVGHGYDPYNHVGHDIVCHMLGIDQCP